MSRSWLAYGCVIVLLAVTGAAILAGLVLDRQSREVRALVRDYLGAVERQDLEAALGYLAPEARPRWHDFTANMLGNRFVLEGISVRAPSFLDRWLDGRPGLADQVTVFVHVNPETPDAWRAVTVLRVERRDGRWLLLEPPLRPASASLDSFTRGERGTPA